MQEYADPVIDWLDAGRGILGRRLFREVSPLFLHRYSIQTSHEIAITEVLTDGSHGFFYSRALNYLMGITPRTYR